MLNYRNIIKFFLITVFLCVVSVALAQIPYRVIVPVPDVDDGTWVYMSDLDKRVDVDSAQVTDHKAVFKGDVDEPFMVTFSADGKRYGTLVLEQGTSTINQATGFGVGTMLNDRLKAVVDNLTAVASGMMNEDADRDSIIAKYIDIEREAINENEDNPIAYFLFLDLVPHISVHEQQAMIAAYPQLAEYEAVKQLMAISENRKNTQPGCMMRDFEVTYDGQISKLSDYVGKGKYVLVDFWASWCGPCMRELETLKQLFEQYFLQGLDFLGVAVWDDPEASQAVIAAKDILWPCIIGAGDEVTDAYGIDAIPCIILFGPDGTIISRDLQGEELCKIVEQEFKP